MKLVDQVKDLLKNLQDPQKAEELNKALGITQPKTIQPSDDSKFNKNMLDEDYSQIFAKKEACTKCGKSEKLCKCWSKSTRCEKCGKAKCTCKGMKKKEAGKSKFDRCVEGVKSGSPEVKSPEAVCVSRGVKPSTWKKAEGVPAPASIEMPKPPKAKDKKPTKPPVVWNKKTQLEKGVLPSVVGSHEEAGRGRKKPIISRHPEEIKSADDYFKALLVHGREMRGTKAMEGMSPAGAEVRLGNIEEARAKLHRVRQQRTEQKSSSPEEMAQQKIREEEMKEKARRQQSKKMGIKPERPAEPHEEETKEVMMPLAASEKDLHKDAKDDNLAHDVLSHKKKLNVAVKEACHPKDMLSEVRGKDAKKAGTMTKEENPDKEADAELGEDVEHLVEDHMKENAAAERKEGHKISFDKKMLDEKYEFDKAMGPFGPTGASASAAMKG